VAAVSLSACASERAPDEVAEASRASEALSTSDPLSSALGKRASPASSTAHERQARVRELVQRLQPRLSRSSDGLVKEPIGGGRHRIHLQGRFQRAAVASRGPDGRMQIDCASDIGEVEALLMRGEP
jgi:hypothetical protein